MKSRMFYARKQLAGTLVCAGLEAAAIRTNVDKARGARPSRGSHLKQREIGDDTRVNSNRSTGTSIALAQL